MTSFQGRNKVRLEHEKTWFRTPSDQFFLEKQSTIYPTKQSWLRMLPDYNCAYLPESWFEPCDCGGEWSYHYFSKPILTMGFVCLPLCCFFDVGGPNPMVSYYCPTKWWKDWSLIPTLTRGKSTNTPIHRKVIAICFHNFPRTLFRIPPPVCQNKSGMNCWLTRGFYGWLLAHSGVIWRDRICQDSSLIKNMFFVASWVDDVEKH